MSKMHMFYPQHGIKAVKKFILTRWWKAAQILALPASSWVWAHSRETGQRRHRTPC
ncbi:MAG: hypothetical protein ACLSHC_09165 [Bilophila wadsworthia]